MARQLLGSRDTVHSWYSQCLEHCQLINVDSLCKWNGAHVLFQNSLSLMLLNIYRYFTNLLLAKSANKSSNPDTPKNAFVLFFFFKWDLLVAIFFIHQSRCYIIAIEHKSLNLFWVRTPTLDPLPRKTSPHTHEHSFSFRVEAVCRSLKTTSGSLVMDTCSEAAFDWRWRRRVWLTILDLYLLCESPQVNYLTSVSGRFFSCDIPLLPQVYIRIKYNKKKCFMFIIFIS